MSNYLVSDNGRVGSLGFYGTKPKTGSKLIRYPRMMKITKGRYAYVGLSQVGQKNHYVHRLVAEAFLKNPDNKPEVNHKNGNRLDNRAINLEWVTAKENCKHRFEVLGQKNKGKMNNKRSRAIIQFDLDTREEIKRYPCAAEAQRQIGGHSASMRAVANGKYSQSGGYGWKYA